jgi:acyl carrier protein
MTKEELFSRIQEILAEEFELDSGNITLESKLYEDLELDSIDAVDLMVKMKEYVHGKIEPEQFKKTRTIQEVVDMLHPLVQSK